MMNHKESVGSDQDPHPPEDNQQIAEAKRREKDHARDVAEAARVSAEVRREKSVEKIVRIVLMG
jgi:hypothetical protein